MPPSRLLPLMGLGPSSSLQVPLRLVAVLGLLASMGCREAPRAIDPSRFEQAGRQTPGQRPKLLARALPSVERLPADLAAEVLQTGYVCAQLPPAERTLLLPPRPDGQFRSVAHAPQGPWHIEAVDLAAHTATVEQALDDQPPIAVWQLDEGWLALVPVAAGLPSSARLRLHRGTVAVTLAADSTTVVSALGEHGTVWYVDQPADATPALWSQALDPVTPPVRLGAARHLWLTLNGGQFLVIRGDGDGGPETQILDVRSGERWRVGPDATAVAAVSDGLVVQTPQGRLLGLGGWPGVEVSLPGAVTGDVLLSGGGHPAVVRSDAAQGVSLLLWFDGRALQPAMSLGAAQWLAAAPLQAGLIAALVSLAGASSPPSRPPWSSQLCVLAPTVKPLLLSELATATAGHRSP